MYIMIRKWNNIESKDIIIKQWQKYINKWLGNKINWKERNN